MTTTTPSAMSTMTTTTMSMRVRPAGLTERLAADLGMRALRWARRRADLRTREAVIAAIEHERVVADRERAWARLDAIRLR